MVETMESIIEALKELEEDPTVPRNIKSKIKGITEMLAEETEKSIRVNKALSELDEVSDDVNLQSYSRTQIWNIVSMLETL